MPRSAEPTSLQRLLLRPDAGDAGFAVGLGGRDIPLDIYRKLHAAIEVPEPRPFSIIDVELEKLPIEDHGSETADMDSNQQRSTS